MSIQATREQQRERERSQREREANAAKNQLSALQTYDAFQMPPNFNVPTHQDHYQAMPMSDPSEDDEQDDETTMNIQNIFGDFNEFSRKIQSSCTIPMVNMVNPTVNQNHNKRKVEAIFSEMNKKHKLHSTQKSLLPDLDSELNATAEKYSSLKHSNGLSSSSTSSSAPYVHQQQYPQIPPPPQQHQPMPPLLQPSQPMKSFNNHSASGSNNSSQNANNIHALNNNNYNNKPPISESSSSSSGSSSEDDSGSSDSDSSDASDSEIETKRVKKTVPAPVAKVLMPIKPEQEPPAPLPVAKHEPKPINVWDLDNFIDLDPVKPVASKKDKLSSTQSQDNGFEQDSPPPESYVVSIDISKLNRIPNNLKRTIDGDKVKNQRHQSSPSSIVITNNVKESKHRDKEEKQRSKDKAREEKIKSKNVDLPPEIVAKSTPPKKSSSSHSSSVIVNKKEIPKEVREVPPEIGNVRTPPTLSNGSMNVSSSKKVSPPEKVFPNSSSTSSSSAAFRNSAISSSSSAQTLLRANMKDKARDKEDKQSKSRHLSPIPTPKESKNRDKEEKPRSKDKAAAREEKSSKSKIVDLPFQETAKSTPPKKSSSSAHPVILKKELPKEVPLDIGNVRTPPNISSNSLPIPSSKKVSPLTKGFPASSAPISSTSSSAFRGNSSTAQAVLRANIKVTEMFERNISDSEAMDRARKFKRSADTQVDPVKQLAGHLESVMFFITACLCFERKNMEDNSLRLAEETIKYIEQANASNRNTKNRYSQTIDRIADVKVQVITSRVRAMLSHRIFKLREKNAGEFRDTIAQINSDSGLKTFIKNPGGTVDQAILVPVKKMVVSQDNLINHQALYIKAHEQWSKADLYIAQNPSEVREFFDALNSKFGHFSIVMPIEEFVNWTLNALKNIYVTSKSDS